MEKYLHIFSTDVFKKNHLESAFGRIYGWRPQIQRSDYTLKLYPIYTVIFRGIQTREILSVRAPI